MINSLKIFEQLQKTLDPETAKTITDIFVKIYEDLQNTVTKAEFNELKEAVQELAEAQTRTESKLEQLTIRIDQLAEAQSRTEARLEQLTIRVDELAEAQKKTEARLEQLTIRVDQLAEAQNRTEARLEQLAEAQSRTETRLEQLAEAQTKTERELRALVRDHKETRRQLGGISATIGYTLENAAMKALPRLLKRDYKLTVKGNLQRKYVLDNRGREIEVNIIGAASKNGEQLTIIGESKSQLSKKAIDDFFRKKLDRLEGVYENLFPVMVAHIASGTKVETYAKDKGVAVYYSYEF